MTAALHLVTGAADLPEYPFGPDNALPGNYFLKWEVGRWLTSDMYLHAEPEVGYAYLNLIFKAQLSRPIGTIPMDPAGQAALLGYDIKRWRSLLRSEPSPLQHWSPYRCEGGVIRLGHHVVIDMISDQLSRRDASALRRQDDAVRKRVDRLRAALAERGVHAGVLRDDTLMQRMEAWMTENLRGRRDFRAYDRVLSQAASEGWFHLKS